MQVDLEKRAGTRRHGGTPAQAQQATSSGAHLAGGVVQRGQSSVPHALDLQT